MNLLEAKSLKIQSRKRGDNLFTCYARVMSEFHVQYSEFRVMPLPFFLKLIDSIAKTDKAQARANRKNKRKR